MKFTPASLLMIACGLPLYYNCLPIAAFAAQKTQVQSANPKPDGLISQGFKPPKRKGPPVSAGGATRGTVCIQGKQLVTPLTPASKWGLTFAQRPQFFWYLPLSSAKTAQFLLLSEADKKILYETTLSLPNQSGIVSYNLPENAPALEINKTYRWLLVLVCDSEDFSTNPRFEGLVERVQPEASLSQKLANADAKKLPAIYAEAGIWYEALSAIAQQRYSNPRNVHSMLGWRQLLNSVGLNAIASQPLLDCCQAENSASK
ncbi:DUF928 domain-containing protein [Aliinostoc sp. HNIBRCY26]|uniref:DUF928 domain-containing protein n=1 Tax=Aliinostoc sp. HNIBRCY26 TaxID=3418997 RepID=UPI003D0002AA